MESKTLLRTKCNLLLPIMALLLLCSGIIQAQTVTTDKPDYYPGETVIITGSGWEAGETVELLIQHMFYLYHPDEYLYAVADENGNIYSDEYIIDPDDLGEVFLLTATGQSSGLVAYAEFTDGDFLGTIEIGTPTGYFLPGQQGDITFPVTVTRAGPGNGNFDVRVCITANFPDFISYTFDVPGYLDGQGIIHVPKGVDEAQGTMTIHYDGTEPGSEAEDTWNFSVMGYVLPNNQQENFNCSNPTNDNATGTWEGVLAFGVAPGITCPAAITQNTDAGECEALVNYDLSYISDPDAVLAEGQFLGIPQPDIYYSLDNTNWTAGTGSGETFSKGETTVYLKAVNIAGEATCSFTVTVEDNEAPVLTGTLPLSESNMNLCYSEMPAGPSADYIKALYADNCGVVNVDKTAQEAENNDNCGWAVTYTYDVYDDAGNHVTPSPTVSYSGSDQDPATGTLPLVPQDVNACMVIPEIESLYPKADDETALESAYSDDCGTVSATFVSESFTPGSGQCGWTLNRIYTISDGCSSNDFNVTLSYAGSDQDPATGAVPAVPQTVNACMVISEIEVLYPKADDETALESTYTDDCGKVSATFVSELFTPESGQCGWTLNRIYTISDGCSSNDFNITLSYAGSDQDPATGTLPSVAQDVNACMDFIEIEGLYPKTDDETALETAYTDDCGTVSATFVSESFTNGSGQCGWTLNRIYTISDGCSSNDFNVTLSYAGSDQDPATGTAPAVPQTVNACMDLSEIEGLYAKADDETALETAYIDDCGTVSATFVRESFTTESGQCNWTLERIYTISDGCNDFNITLSYAGSDQDAATLVDDAVLPGATDINACMDATEIEGLYFKAADETTLEAAYEDDCGTVMATYKSEAFTDESGQCAWALVRTYTISDGCSDNDFDVDVTYSGSDQDPATLVADAVLPGATGVDACMDAEKIAELYSKSDDETALEAAYEDDCGTVTATYKSEAFIGESNQCDWVLARSYTISDGCNDFDVKVTYSGGDQTPPTVLTEDISVSLEADGSVTIADDAVNYGSSDNCGGDLTFELSKIYFTCADVGENEVTLTVTDECDNSATGTATVTITVPTVTTALVSAEAARYMDEVTLYAEIESYCGIDNLEGTVEFFLDGASVGSAPAYPIPEGEEGNPDKLRATLIYKIDALPKTDYANDSYVVTAEFTPSTAYYEESEDATELLIYPRKADPFNADYGFYTGQILAWTTGPNSSTGTITMAAMLKDNNVPEGDLRGAKVTFCYVNGDGSLSPIPSAKNLPVSLVDMTDGTVGAASADVQVDIGNAEAGSFHIAVMITGGYQNNPNSEAAQAIVTVAKPVAGGSILGGGWLTNADSEGQIKGAFSKKTGFEFDVKYNKKQTNLQGKMTIQIRSWYKPDGTLDNVLHNYIVTSNAINLMVLGPNEGLEANQAIFDAKANLSEMLEDGTIVTVDGNSPLHVRMTDGGENPEEDFLAITYYNSAGGIWFSSNFKWEDVGDEVTEEQALADGEIVVKGDGTTSDGSSPKPGRNKSAEISTDEAAVHLPHFSAYPNPFTDRVRFEFVPAEEGNVRIDMYDMTGRLVQTVFDQMVQAGIQYNAEFKPEAEVGGTYIYRMVMGDAVQYGKVIYAK